MAKRGRTDGPARVLDSRPELPTYLVHFWEAFQRLTTTRQIAMGGVGPIPWTAIDAYATRYKYYGDAYEELLYFVEVLDGVYLQSQASPGRPVGGPPPPRRST